MTANRIVGAWLIFAFAVLENVVRPLQTLSNLVAAFREEDFSFRAGGTRGEYALSYRRLQRYGPRAYPLFSPYSRADGV